MCLDCDGGEASVTKRSFLGIRYDNGIDAIEPELDEKSFNDHCAYPSTDPDTIFCTMGCANTGRMRLRLLSVAIGTLS